MKLSKFEVLSQQEVQMVHQASLDVLEHCGVKIMSDKVLVLLEANGALVNHETRIAKFPPSLVEQCLKTIPAQFDLYDRKGEMVMVIGDGSVHCASGHNAVFCIDATTLKRRYATVRDVEEFGIVSQAMSSIDIVGVPLNPMDVSPRSTLLHATKALLETTEKPLFLSTESCEIVDALIKMMKVIGGDDVQKRPNAIIQLSPSSPLFWEIGAAEGTMLCAQENIPLNILPEPMSGVSAPYSVVGLLTEHNIEVLSGVVISQLTRPGAPILYGSSWTTYEMRYSTALIGSPESTLLRIAGCQMARHYKMPSHTTATNTDSNAHDEQHAWESVLSNIAAMNAQNDIVMNSGMFATGLTTSLEQLVMDNEVNNIIKRLMRGVEVTADHIGAEVIRQVGPAGNFMMEDHTLDRLYGDEFFVPSIRANTQYESWMADGAPTAEILAARIVEKILAKGNSASLEAATTQKLADVIRDFEAIYC